MIDVVNVVAGGDLNREVDIELLCSELSKVKNIEAEFTDGINWQLVINFHKFGKILLYRTGSYIIRGGSSLDTLEKIKNRWFSLIKEENIVGDTSTVDYTLQNIVFSGDLKQKIDLAVLSIQLGINKTEYEPEQFPGLFYRPESEDWFIILFSSGSVVVDGISDMDILESAYKKVDDMLSNNGI